jgi:hypothetical protein
MGSPNMNKQFYAILPDDLEKSRISRPEVNPCYVCVIGPFDYPHLPGPDHIQLLHLEPSCDDFFTLRGSLKVHRLDSQCEYEAISYY